MRRPVIAVVAVLASVLALLLGSGSVAAAETTVQRVGTIDWKPCTDRPALDCATLSVPVDWARPRGPAFDLALARLRSADPSARTGSLLINPGGPGGSGIGFVGRAEQYFSADLRKHFDIVGWDPRGVGRSHPVLCDADLEENAVSEFPRNRAEFAALLAYHDKLGRSCREATGPLFDHVDTISTVRDLEAIRAALGEGDLTYYGISYGTGIGQQYAELFPHRIRAMALDSNMDHSLHAFDYLATETGDFERSFTQFSKWCVRSTLCALNPRDPRDVLDTLYAQARRGELHVPGQPDQVIAPEELLNDVLGELYRITNWVRLSQTLLGLLTGSAQQNALAHPKARHAGTVPDPYQAIWCKDHKWNVPTFSRLEQLRRAMNRIAPHTHVSTLGWTDVTGCLGWPDRVTNPQRPLRVHGSPTLFLANSLYDVSTPYPWATNAARQLGRTAVLLTYEGTGHGVYTPSPCARAAIDSYLIRRVTPPRGARCPAVFPDTVGQDLTIQQPLFDAVRPGGRTHS